MDVRPTGHGRPLSRYALTSVIEDVLGIPIPERNVEATLRCPLPTHPERHPSFRINLDKGLWLCHACGEKGGLQRLARLMETEVDEADLAVRRALELARSSGFEEPVDFWDKAVRYQFYDGDPIPPEVRAFCKAKAINKPALYHYRVGWDPDRRRVQFPYWDDGKCVALKYRYLDAEGDKKRNKGSETGSKKSILDIDNVRGARLVFLCEGESDTLALWSYLNRHDMLDGVAVGGVPGADTTPERWELWALDMLWAERVYVCFDGDAAGDKGADKAASVLGDKFTRIRPPDGYDLAGYLSEGGKMSALGLRRRDIQPVMQAA